MPRLRGGFAHTGGVGGGGRQGNAPVPGGRLRSACPRLPGTVPGMAEMVPAASAARPAQTFAAVPARNAGGVAHSFGKRSASAADHLCGTPPQEPAAAGSVGCRRRRGSPGLPEPPRPPAAATTTTLPHARGRWPANLPVRHRTTTKPVFRGTVSFRGTATRS